MLPKSKTPNVDRRAFHDLWTVSQITYRLLLTSTSTMRATTTTLETANTTYKTKKNTRKSRMAQTVSSEHEDGASAERGRSVKNEEWREQSAESAGSRSPAPELKKRFGGGHLPAGHELNAHVQLSSWCMMTGHSFSHKIKALHHYTDFLLITTRHQFLQCICFLPSLNLCDITKWLWYYGTFAILWSEGVLLQKFSHTTQTNYVIV